MNTLPKYKLISEDEYKSLVETESSLKEQNKKLSKSESQIYNMWREQYRRAEDLELALKVINDSDLAKQIVELKKELREKIHKREYDIWRLERIIVRKKQRLREYEDAIIRRNAEIKELKEENDRLKQELEYKNKIVKGFKEYLEKDVKRAFSYFITEIINEEEE